VGKIGHKRLPAQLCRLPPAALVSAFDGSLRLPSGMFSRTHNFPGRSHMNRQFRLSFAGAGLILGSVASAQDSPGSLDGCTPLKADEVQAIIGEKLEREPRTKGLKMLSVESVGCNYRSEGWTIEVRLERGRDEDEAKGYMKTLQGISKQPGKDARPVRGLGGDAWWGPISPTNGILTVLRKGDVLWVQTYGKGTGAGSLEKTQALMEKWLAAYERLPRH
jgi:hypothetical protein